MNTDVASSSATTLASDVIACDGQYSMAPGAVNLNIKVFASRSSTVSSFTKLHELTCPYCLFIQGFL